MSEGKCEKWNYLVPEWKKGTGLMQLLKCLDNLVNSLDIWTIYKNRNENK